MTCRVVGASPSCDCGDRGTLLKDTRPRLRKYRRDGSLPMTQSASLDRHNIFSLSACKHHDGPCRRVAPPAPSMAQPSESGAAATLASRRARMAASSSSTKRIHQSSSRLFTFAAYLPVFASHRRATISSSSSGGGLCVPSLACGLQERCVIQHSCRPLPKLLDWVRRRVTAALADSRGRL